MRLNCGRRRKLVMARDMRKKRYVPCNSVYGKSNSSCNDSEECKYVDTRRDVFDPNSSGFFKKE